MPLCPLVLFQWIRKHLVKYCLTFCMMVFRCAIGLQVFQESVCQIVVPKVFRGQLLNLAHGHCLSRHFSIRKTFNHLNFLKSYVVKICLSCHTCQEPNCSCCSIQANSRHEWAIWTCYCWLCWSITKNKIWTQIHQCVQPPMTSLRLWWISSLCLACLNASKEIRDLILCQKPYVAYVMLHTTQQRFSSGKSWCIREFISSVRLWLPI